MDRMLEVLRNITSPLLKRTATGVVAGKYVPQKRKPMPMPTQAPTQAPTPTPSPVYEYGEGGKPEVPLDLRSYIESEAQARRIDPSILASILAQETGGYGYQPVRGGSGEVGISQIIPEFYWNQTGAGATDLASYAARLESDPEFAIHEMARILQDLLLAMGGNLPAQGQVFPEYTNALAAYNAGLGNIQGGMPYAQDVLGRIGSGQ